MSSEVMRLFEEHERLIYHVCGKFRARIKRLGIDYEDALQEGFIALLEAAKRYDPQKGFRFSTYACSWIKGYVQSYICKSCLVKSRRGEPPQIITSLDAPINGEVQIARLELLMSQESDFSSAIVDEILCSMSAMERAIVASRLEGKTQVEVATEVGVSQAQISRILKKVGQKLCDYYERAV